MVERVIDGRRLRRLLDHDQGGERIDIDPLAVNAYGAESVVVIAGLVPLAAVPAGRQRLTRSPASQACRLPPERMSSIQEPGTIGWPRATPRLRIISPNSARSAMVAHMPPAVRDAPSRSTVISASPAPSGCQIRSERRQAKGRRAARSRIQPRRSELGDRYAKRWPWGRLSRPSSTRKLLRSAGGCRVPAGRHAVEREGTGLVEIVLLEIEAHRHVEDMAHRGIAIGRAIDLGNIELDRRLDIEKPVGDQAAGERPGQRLAHREENMRLARASAWAYHS